MSLISEVMISEVMNSEVMNSEVVISEVMISEVMISEVMSSEASPVLIIIISIFIIVVAHHHPLPPSVTFSGLGGCIQELSVLLTPGSGSVPRVLSEPLAPGNLAVKLHVMRLQQELFDMPCAVLERLLLLPPPAEKAPSSAPTPASFFVRPHLVEAVHLYHAAAGGSLSACAELCEMHLRLLHSLVRILAG